MNKEQILQLMKQQQATISCVECKAEFSYRAEKHDLGNGLYELGIRCPVCDEWYHSYFITDKIIRLPRKNRNERRHYKAELRRLNKKERKKRGIRKVNGRWVSG